MIFFSFFLVAFVKSYEANQMQNKCVVSKNEFDSVPVPYREYVIVN